MMTVQSFWISRLKDITSVVESCKEEILNVIGAARVLEGFNVDRSIKVKLLDVDRGPLLLGNSLRH